MYTEPNETQQEDLVADYIAERTGNQYEKQVKSSRNGLIFLGIVMLVTRLSRYNKWQFGLLWWQGLIFSICMLLMAWLSKKKPFIAFTIAAGLYIADTSFTFLIYGLPAYNISMIGFRLLGIFYVCRWAVYAYRYEKENNTIM